MQSIQIRQAVKNDASLILHFIHELANYERAAHEVSASVSDIESSIFSDNSRVHALICEYATQPIGFAVYFYNYSTWLGKQGIYLEDLYISPEHRGMGAGTALLRHLARKAVDENCGRFEWSVLDWNTPAINFYQSIGAKPKSEWVGYQLAGNALNSFAQDK